MSYLGNEPRFSQFPSKFFDGDGTAMTVSLDYAPPNGASLLVFISGVRQDTSAYNLIGTSLTFTGTVPSGTANVQVVHLGQSVDAGVVADDSVTNIMMADDAVGIAELSATGTSDATTFLRGDNSWQVVSSTPDLTTEGDLYKNYDTISTTLSTAVDADSNQGLIGPITITGDWTLVGDVTIW